MARVPGEHPDPGAGECGDDNDPTLSPHCVQVGDQVSICVRRKRFFRGGTFGPWRFLTGTLRQGFRPDFGGGFGGDGGDGVGVGGFGGDGVDVEVSIIFVYEKIVM